jgi:hypothetical protein
MEKMGQSNRYLVLEQNMEIADMTKITSMPESLEGSLMSKDIDI